MQQHQLTSEPKYGFGSSGEASLGVPAGAFLQHEDEVHSFTKSKDAREMDQEEKIRQAKLHKDRGNTFFKESKFQLAVKHYKTVVYLLQYDSGLDDAQKAESHEVLLAGHLNLAMAHLKLGHNDLAREAAGHALAMDAANVKALFRRGQASLNMGDPEDALKDFEACVTVDPSNKAAKNQAVVCRTKINAIKQKEKKLYGGMFDKFAEIDKAKEQAEYNRIRQGPNIFL